MPNLGGTKPAAPRRPRRTEIRPEQEKYLDWLLTIPRDREPSTEKLFAKAHGVSFETTRVWKSQDAVFIREWEKRLHQLNMHPDRTQAVMDAMFDKAREGDTKAAALYLQIVDKMTPSRIVLEDARKVSDLSDEELVAMADNVTALRPSA